MEKQKVEIIPYLSFAGNCDEAVHTYINAFGGEINYISHWSASTDGVKLEQIGKVMHVEFKIGNSRMAAGDSFDSAAVNTNIKLMIHMNSEAEAIKAIAVLAEGGTVLAPLQPHPEPDDDGCGSIIKDRFDFTWIITCPNPAKQ